MNVKDYKAREIISKIESLFANIKSKNLPVSMEFELDKSWAIGKYASSINCLSFMVSLRYII